MTISNKDVIYTILQSWENATAELADLSIVENEHIRTAAAILLVGGARSDDDVERLCGILWTIWEDYKHAV